jgi:hypothetical protein
MFLKIYYLFLNTYNLNATYNNTLLLFYTSFIISDLILLIILKL